jgi:hypothetical protein
MWISKAGTIHRWFSGAYLMRSSGHILLSLLPISSWLNRSLISWLLFCEVGFLWCNSNSLENIFLKDDIILWSLPNAVISKVSTHLANEHSFECQSCSLCRKNEAIPATGSWCPLNNSLAWIHEQTIPTERPPLIDEVSANFCGYGDFV